MQTIHLQGIGEKPAIPAKELKIGDVTIWNYGFTETIIGILKQTTKSIVFQIKSNNTGYIGQRRIYKNTLVAKMKR